MHEEFLLTIFFLPAILLLGTVTSIEDFKYSRIRNVWIVGGLAYAAAAYILFWLLSMFNSWYFISPKISKATVVFLWNADEWLVNLFVSAIAGYLLWRYRLWAAGDAKLFIVYAALIPMREYPLVYFHYYFVSFLLLVTIFVPATLYLFFRSLWASRTFLTPSHIGMRLRHAAKGITGRRLVEYSMIFIGFFVFFLSFQVLRAILQDTMGAFIPDQSLIMIIALLAFRRLSGIFRKKPYYIFVLSGLLVWYIRYASWETVFGPVVASLGRSLGVIILFPLAKKIVNAYTDTIAVKTTPFAHWMFLGALIIWII